MKCEGVTEHEKEGGVFMEGWCPRENRAFVWEERARQGKRRMRGGMMGEGGKSAREREVCAWDDAARGRRVGVRDWVLRGGIV